MCLSTQGLLGVTLCAVQRGHLVLGVSGVLCAGILYSWVKSQNADKPVLADTNHKGENKGTPAASY